MSILAGECVSGMSCPFCLPRVGAPPPVAQPQPYEMAGVRGVVLELGAGVADRAIVDELDLAGFEVKIGRDRPVVEDVEHRREGGGALVVERLAPHGIPAP